MIKVLHICPALGSGGIEKLIRQWDSAAISQDIRFVFATYTAGGDTFEYFCKKGYSIYVIRQLKDIGLKKYKQQFENIIKKENIDELHINAGPITWIPLKAAKKAGVQVRIIHSHTNKYVLPKSKIVRKIIETAARYFNVKYSTVRLSCGGEAGRYCFGESKFTVINNGINVQQFRFDRDIREKQRKNLGLSNNFTIGLIGRLAEQKNPLFAIEVFNEIKKGNSQAHLLIVGEGPLEKKMKDLCKQLSLKDVTFVGSVKNVIPYYDAIDVLLLPSLYEGAGIVLVEAQAMGLPIFVSEFVPDDTLVTALSHKLSLSMSPRDWAEEICKQITSDCDRDNSWIEIQKKGFDSTFTINQMVKVYISEYKKVNVNESN